MKGSKFVHATDKVDPITKNFWLVHFLYRLKFHEVTNLTPKVSKQQATMDIMCRKFREHLGVDVRGTAWDRIGYDEDVEYASE